MDDLIGSDYISLIAPPERESASRRLSTLLGREMPSVNLERVLPAGQEPVLGPADRSPLRNGKERSAGWWASSPTSPPARKPKPAWPLRPASSRPATRASSLPMPNAASFRSTRVQRHLRLQCRRVFGQGHRLPRLQAAPRGLLRGHDPDPRHHGPLGRRSMEPPPRRRHLPRTAGHHPHRRQRRPDLQFRRHLHRHFRTQEVRGQNAPPPTTTT